MAHSPFQSLPRLTPCGTGGTRTRPAAERRLQLPHFVETFRWESIRPLLPLQLPTPGQSASLVWASVSFVLPVVGDRQFADER